MRFYSVKLLLVAEILISQRFFSPCAHFYSRMISGKRIMLVLQQFFNFWFHREEEKKII